jgi:outer membrane protein assembly factor BamA
MNRRTRNLLILFLAALAPVFLTVNADTLAPPRADSALVPSQKIVEINYCGNHVTKPIMLRIYLGIDTGEVYDSALIAAGKKRLMDTYLFSKVEVLRLQKLDGVHVFVLVTEFFYWMPTGSFDLFRGMYGDDNTLWWRMRLGLSLLNFRGLFETFSVATSFWQDKGLSLSWSKPFVPSPYFFSAGISGDQSPDLSFPRRLTVGMARVTVGRRFFGNSKSFLSIIPTYNRIDSLAGPDRRIEYGEVMSQLGWVTDRKNRSYDPTDGWQGITSLSTNVLYPGTNYKYLQWNNDLRLYHRGFFSQDRFASRMQLVLRSNDAGPYKGLYIGGESTVRGWATDALGRDSVMNDFATVSGEYRFPLWPTPSFDLPVLCDYAPSLKNFYLRADGALILDAGQIWRYLPSPFGVHQDAAGVGVGLRIMAPTLLRAACADLVWPIRPHDNPVGIWYSKTPGYHLYLDMYY